MAFKRNYYVSDLYAYVCNPAMNGNKATVQYKLIYIYEIYTWQTLRHTRMNITRQRNHKSKITKKKNNNKTAATNTTKQNRFTIL